MLEIQINNEFLDLVPGAVLDMERQNPFLQFNQELVGTYSLPFQVRNNERNSRLLNYSGVFQKAIAADGIPATIFDNGIPLHRGKIKVERSSHHLNNEKRTTISCYFLTESADFWQDIKDKNLRDINAGGDRSFNWDGLITDTGTGFWRHIHQVANAAPNSYDYAFYPVINKAWYTNDYAPDIMNMMYYDPVQTFKVRFPTNYVPSDHREANRIVPMPYLHYVLKKCFELVGWKLKGDILTDLDFLRITMVNFRAIDWAAPGTGTNSYWPKDPVVFNIKDHLPDKTISSFLIALKNRLGWWYDFDTISKTCTIRLVRDIIVNAPVDVTPYANPVADKEKYTDTLIYALRCTDGIGGGNLDTTLINYQGRVDERSDLPAASEAIYGHVYLILIENNYMICERNTADAYEWALFSANLYDFVPANTTDDINTDAGTLPMEPYNAYFTLLPRIDNQGQWFGRNDEDATWGIHLLFFHGKVNKAVGSTEQYPYASSHPYDPSMNQVAVWALTYTAFLSDGRDIGLYKTFWEAFLTMIKSTEEITLTAYLPFTAYKKLSYDKPLLLSGVRLFIKTVKPSIPYKEQLTINALRI